MEGNNGVWYEYVFSIDKREPQLKKHDLYVIRYEGLTRRVAISLHETNSVHSSRNFNNNVYKKEGNIVFRHICYGQDEIIYI